MVLRKLEICVPPSQRQRVLDALQEEGGIASEDHVGEHLVVVNAENCCKIELVCAAARSGELLGMLTSKCGVGVDYGTVSSASVASFRPHPSKLEDEFKAMCERFEETYKSQVKPKRKVKKFKYLSASTEKSVEELWNEIVDLSVDNNKFYLNLICADIIASIGLMVNSPVVVLSAMLIAPLMGPIMAGAFGMAVGNYPLMRSAIMAEFRATGATLLCSVFMACTAGWFFANSYVFPSS